MPLQSRLLAFGGRFDPSRPSLPIEVEEHALSYLDRWEDATTIANCAQVCSKWLPSSRHKLYDEVALPSRERWQLFERTLLSQDPSPLGGVSRYLEAVRKLTLGPSSEPDNTERWAVTALIGCAPYLPELSHMVLSWIVWDAPKELDGLHRYPKLETLETRFCSFVEITDLHDFIIGLPALKHLCIGLHELENEDELDVDVATLSDMSDSDLSEPDTSEPDTSETDTSETDAFEPDTLAGSEALTVPTVVPRLSRLEVVAWPEAMLAICSWLVKEEWPVRYLTEIVWRPGEHKYQGSIREDYRITEWFRLSILPLISSHSLEVLYCTTDITIELHKRQFAGLKSVDILYPEEQWSELMDYVHWRTEGLGKRSSVRPLEEAHFEFRVPKWPDSPTDLNKLNVVAETLSSPVLANLRTFGLTLTISARPSYSPPTWPIDFDTSSVADFLAQYDTNPMTPDELSATTTFSNPGLNTAAWVDLLVSQTEGILQRRIQAQFESLSSRFTVNIVVAMKIWLDGAAQGWEGDEDHLR